MASTERILKRVFLPKIRHFTQGLQQQRYPPFLTDRVFVGALLRPPMQLSGKARDRGSHEHFGQRCRGRNQRRLGLLCSR